MLLLVLFFVLSIVFSFLCSIWEAVLLSITPSYITSKEQDGSPIGKSLKAFKEDIDRPLSAILTLNTIAHTVGAIGVGSQAGKMFGTSEGIFGISYESIIAGVMTLAILILSEIIPKTIGANLWKSLAPFTVRSLNLLMTVLAPFVWISQLITKKLKKDKDKSVLSRSDFAALARAGEETGVLKTQESKTIRNLLRLDQITVADIMTPRVVILSASEDMSLREFYEAHDPLPYSRIPVYGDNPDAITGFVLRIDMLDSLIHNKDDKPLKDLKRDILIVHGEDTLSELLETLMKNDSHMSIVVDEFGGVTGLVTMEDVFETLLGLEIVDESDEVRDLQEFARNMWKKRRGLISRKNNTSDKS